MGVNPHFGFPGLSLRSAGVTMSQLQPHRDPKSMAAYTPAGLLVLYVLIRVIF
jgi:hypothetical protein